MRGIVLPSLILLAAFVSPAIPAPMANDVHVEFQEERDGVRRLEGRFHVAAQPETVMAVLSDFEALPRFVSSVESSRITDRRPPMTVVEQVMAGRVGPLRKRMALRLEVYQTPSSLSFRDVLRRSFRSYEGSWGLIQRGNVVEVVYELKAQPLFHAPGFLVDKAFRQSVERLLGEVRSEIVLRATPQAVIEDQ